MKKDSMWFIRCGRCGKSPDNFHECIDTSCFYRDKNGHNIFSASDNQPNDDISSVLNGMPEEFEGYSKDDIIASQHLIILNLKKRVADLERDLYSHNTCLNQNY